MLKKLYGFSFLCVTSLNPSSNNGDIYKENITNIDVRKLF